MSDAPFMLGISGCRGIVDATMTSVVAARLAACWGEHLAKSSAESSDAPLVCLGRDSRPSGAAFLAAAAAGLTQVGCKVVDLGIVATPTLGVAIGAMRAAGGVMITASHNPGEWNGLKLLDHRGTAPGGDTAKGVVERYNRGGPPDIDALAVVPCDVETRATDTHLSKVLGLVHPGRVQAAAPRVFLDSVRGAGGPAGRALLDAMGCDVVHQNHQTDGAFPRPPEPTEDNLRLVSNDVVNAGAMVGFVQDPDADRLAVLDARGRYIGEEFTLVLAAWAVLRNRPGSVVVANMSTSRMIDHIAARFNCTVRRSAVGEANVAQLMRTTGAAIGGEGNGGVIVPEVTWVRDSLSAMALTLDLAVSESASISELVASVPPHAMVKRTLPLADRDMLAPALDRLRTAFAHESLDESDGIRIDLDEGWVHVRPSNTEPIARIISEASSAASAAALADRIAAAAGLSQ